MDNVTLFTELVQRFELRNSFPKFSEANDQLIPTNEYTTLLQDSSDDLEY